MLHEIVLSLGWDPMINICSWSHWIGLRLLEWVGVQWNACGASGMDGRHLEWCGTKHMHSSSELWAYNQYCTRSLSTGIASIVQLHTLLLLLKL